MRTNAPAHSDCCFVLGLKVEKNILRKILTTVVKILLVIVALILLFFAGRNIQHAVATHRAYTMLGDVKPDVGHEITSKRYLQQPNTNSRGAPFP